MAELKAIREALAASLAPISGLHQSPYVLNNPTPPAAEVVPGKIDYDQTFQRGSDKWKLIVRVFVGVTSDVGAQKRLDKMLDSSGPTSIKAAVEADDTLGGLVSFAHVSDCSGYRQYKREGGAPLLGAEWTVEVRASGT